MSQLTDDQIEIINDFIQESRDMLDNLEPTIIELGQSCQNVDCWSVLDCSNEACSRHGKSLKTACWLDEGYIGDGARRCVFAESESDCRSCQVFTLTNGDPETMNAIFRLFHSMKGSAGFLEFENVSHVAHQAENLLDLIRSGKIMLEEEHVDLLCKTCDFAREALDYIESNYDDEGMAEAGQAIGEELGRVIESAKKKAAKTSDQTDDANPATADGEASVASVFCGDEFLGKFVEEGEELLNAIEELVLAWEKAPDDADLVGELFRSIHSFKGNCGFAGYRQMEHLAHQMESVLDAARQGRSFTGGPPAEVLLQCVDALSKSMALVAAGEKEDVSCMEELGQALEAVLTEKKQPEARQAEAPLPDPEELRLADILVRRGVVAMGTMATLMRTKTRPLVDALIGCEIATKEQIDKAIAEEEKERRKAEDEARKAQKTEKKEMPGAKNVGKVQPAKPVQAVKKPPVQAKRQDIRVDLEKLDKLINLIGEMVIAENMLVHSPDLEGLELENFSKASQQMSKIVRELQEMAMVIRMIPVSGLFRRMIRLVHDLSNKTGKKVEFELEGEETEVDKTVIEQISDPLVHLLRNSLDHGLESPEERLAAGKPEKGLLKLSARHEEGEVWITVEDDGRGLDREKILAKAIDKGLIEGDGSEMSDRAVYNLIFQPGFSTAEKITDISGRGVGMDVVRQNLEKIRGKIEVYSKPGEGTTIKLRIPLTLAIIDGLMVRVGETRCILPLLAVREIFRPLLENLTHTPDGQELVRVRENFIPILRLHRVLDVEPESRCLEDGVLVVLEHQGDRICLLVDEILGQQQTVIKGLSDYLGNVDVAAGCTILGNGDVCLILDVGSMIDLVEEGNCVELEPEQVYFRAG
ncbi:two-component system chemotaxis sensor kinase CheA [Geothermobacter ehrlichii]|uniref:Chemotaxis protein CheA n=1 Tax=Geothermobacter ehrlichii TaxID=213224 RepID=A0A5D3WNT9_9BACT|nr:chemotaxis protein CheA [Geothermobacter ehrlichii]TYP00218.1 two-component system chemotaxis sensor kinase CheA [Geothermobacter ehrlichii]